MAISKTETVGADGIITLAFDQDAAQEDSLVAAPGANQRIIVIGFMLSMDAAGTVKFEDEDDVNLSGTFDVAANGAIGWKGSSRNPLFTLAKNKALQIESATGKASGLVKYRTLSAPAAV